MKRDAKKKRHPEQEKKQLMRLLSSWKKIKI